MSAQTLSPVMEKGYSGRIRAETIRDEIAVVAASTTPQHRCAPQSLSLGIPKSYDALLRGETLFS